MPNAANAKVQYEAGQQSVAMAALPNSGDNKIFKAVSGLWSKVSGYAPVIRPNGLVSGGAITPAAAGGNDNVDVAAGTAYINGVLVSFNAETDLTITRGATTDVASITSITVAANGAAAAVPGTDHTAFSEVRGDPGGPPLIAVDQVELGQVRTGSITAAPIVASEIFSTVGVHTERYDYPAFEVDHFNGQVEFVSALPAIHTGPVPKAVYASYATPIMVDVQHGNDFVPPEESYSVNSTQIYGGTLGSVTKSLGAGSFTAFLKDGVTDGLIGLQGEDLWFKYWPNRYNAAHIICQGVLGITRSFPAGDNISAACTINAESKARNQAA